MRRSAKASQITDQPGIPPVLCGLIILLFLIIVNFNLDRETCGVK